MADKTPPAAPPAAKAFIPVRVRAMAPGTYPVEPGGRPKYRNVGEEFLVFEESHLAWGDLNNPDIMGWMQPVTEAPRPPPDPNITQTTVPNTVKDPQAILTR